MAGAFVSASVGVLNPLLTKLSALVEGEYKLLKSVKKDIIFLRNELSSISVLLEHLSTKEDKLDGPTKEWRNNMLELAYDIEDCIDLFIHKLSCGDANANFVQKIGSKIKKLWGKHQITECIQELKNRVMEEDQRRKRNQIDDFISEPSVVEIDPRLPALYEEVERLVGIDGPREKIIKWIMTKGKPLEQRKVVSIVGLGGLGKTTLANEVYKTIQGDFKCITFVSISRTPNIRKILVDMLKGLGSNGDVSEDEQNLISHLRGFLKDKRYLIVVDDIWDIGAWKVVNCAFPENNLGSIIITTTRNTAVAEACSRTTSEGYLHSMQPLEEQDSQRLFYRRAFNSDSCCPPHLEDISHAIISKCRGLPLAIISIASLLSIKPDTEDQWMQVHNSIGVTLNSDVEVRKILMLSYYDLPYPLKNCLLYLSMYPEDYVIDRQELIWRWIAEGFIIEAKGKTREQVGENYFNELINRSLIQPVYIQYDGRASCCRVHDIVLDLIISLSTGQNFVTIVHEQQHWSSFKKIRRTWFPSNGTDNRIVKEITNNCSHVRSLFFDSPKPEQIPQFKKCHALRVLVLDGCMSLESQHINSLTYLFQLKYLKLNVANVTEMPKDIGRLQQLETLIIHGGGHVNEINIPSSVCRLQKLERLIVDYPMRLPDEIGFLQALEMLSLFYNIEYSIKCLQELRRLTRLRYLRIRTPFGGDVARFERYKDAFYMTLDELGKNSLQSLHVHVTTKFSDTLMDSCCSSAPGLRELSISGVGISKLSEQMVSLSNLAYLVIFYNTRSNDQKYINLLGCIPKLLYLKVIFPQGGEDGLTVGCGGFPCLKELMFRHSRLHWLLFEPGAMPKLQRLSIELFAQKAASNLGFEQSFVHLSSLQHLIVVLDCSDATTRDVKALEDAIRNVASIQTRCLTLEILRRYEDEMVKEDEEEQLKGSTEGGGTEAHHIQ
uniref:AAA+ ATPase domain-containing protein n=1 Tax=Oryza nivara TaxID=4536 RepID=A0A0E0J8S1_ORYNI